MSATSDIPLGWMRCRLGDVVDYGSACKVEPNEISDDDWVLELEDIEKDTARLLRRATFRERQSRSTKNSFKKGDVLYGKLRPYLNKVLQADGDGYCTTEIIPIRAPAGIVPRYLFHWLRHPDFTGYVNAVSHGVNMPRLGTEAGRAAPFVLAPAAEQKRVAHKLDNLIARVDACRDRLDRVPGIVMRFRQAVLAAATSGHLTEDWPGHTNRADWAATTLGGCGEVSGGLTKNAKRNEFGLVKPYLRVANVYANRLELGDVASIGLTEAEYRKTKLERNDLLLVEGNGSLDQLGRVAMWRGELPECSHQNQLIRWRSQGPNAAFVLYWLLSPEGRASLMALASTTTGLHTLSISKVQAVSIALPTHAEQAEIVRRVNALFALADAIEARCQAARDKVERLTPVLLAKAFRGELVAQDPSDEPASELLARLRAQGATSGSGDPRSGRRNAKREISA